MISWFHPFFIEFLSKTNAIELDYTFKILSPYKTCIPQIIVKNTGVPMGLIAGPSEDFYIYSMLFEALNKIDKANRLFKSFQKIPYVTNEHLSFNKLGKVYKLEIIKCFTHLIRSIGAHSSLALFRDILYYYSEKEFANSIIENFTCSKSTIQCIRKKGDETEDSETQDSENENDEIKDDALNSFKSHRAVGMAMLNQIKALKQINLQHTDHEDEEHNDDTNKDDDDDDEKKIQMTKMIGNFSRLEKLLA